MGRKPAKPEGFDNQTYLVEFHVTHALLNYLPHLKVPGPTRRLERLGPSSS